MRDVARVAEYILVVMRASSKVRPEEYARLMRTLDRITGRETG